MELGATPMQEKKIRSNGVERLISILKCMAGFLLGIFQGGIYCYANFFRYAIVFGPNFREGQKFSGGKLPQGGAQACREGQSRLGGASVPCNRKPEVLSI